MEVICNGRVGDLLAELSGREVIELLDRYLPIFVRLFLFLDAHCVEKLDLSKKNVANLCRYTYLPGGGRQIIVGRPHSWTMYFTLKMFASPTKCASPTINPWRRPWFWCYCLPPPPPPRRVCYQRPVQDSRTPYHG